MPRPLALRVFIIRAVTVMLLLASWEALSRSGLIFVGVVPPTLEVLKSIVEQLSDQSFYRDLMLTGLEAATGFAWGSLIAIVSGVALGLAPYGRKMLEPWIVAVAGTPKIIFLPIIFLVFGLGFESKMAKAAISAFFPVVLNCTAGMVEIPPVLIRVGKGFDLTAWQMMTKVYLPAIAAPLVTGLRLGMAMAIIGVLAAEIAYSNAGLGYRLIHSADQFKIPAVYAITILIFAGSASVNLAFSRIQDWVGQPRHQDAARLGDLPLARTEAT
jgi:ABC-type nitrate/sulfonate/bicarbonate transport system permease component